MEQTHTRFADKSAPIRPQVSVSVLHCRQTASLDPCPVDHIFAVKGQAEAEEMICRVLEDIAHRLYALQVAKATMHLTKLQSQLAGSRRSPRKLA